MAEPEIVRLCLPSLADDDPLFSKKMVSLSISLSIPLHMRSLVDLRRPLLILLPFCYNWRKLYRVVLALQKLLSARNLSSELQLGQGLTKEEVLIGLDQLVQCARILALEEVR